MQSEASIGVQLYQFSPLCNEHLVLQNLLPPRSISHFQPRPLTDNQFILIALQTILKTETIEKQQKLCEASLSLRPRVRRGARAILLATTAWTSPLFRVPGLSIQSCSYLESTQQFIPNQRSGFVLLVSIPAVKAERKQVDPST